MTASHDHSDGNTAVDEDDDPDIEDLLDEFEDLEAAVDTEAEREQVRETMRTATAVAAGREVFGRVIRGYDRGDVAEAVLGSILFGIPMLVESGTLEIGAFLASHPLFHAMTLAFGVGIVITIIYVADIQEVRVHRPILGIVPRRLAGVILVSYTMGAFLMVLWGRTAGLDPSVALASVTVAFVPMAIGAALGDILPGS